MSPLLHHPHSILQFEELDISLLGAEVEALLLGDAVMGEDVGYIVGGFVVLGPEFFDVFEGVGGSAGFFPDLFRFGRGELDKVALAEPPSVQGGRVEEFLGSGSSLCYEMPVCALGVFPPRPFVWKKRGQTQRDQGTDTKDIK